jgi:hypothetical protein
MRWSEQDLLSSGGDQRYEAKQHIQSTVGDVLFRPEDNRLVRPVIIARARRRTDMKNPGDHYEIIEVAPGEPLMLKPDASGGQLGPPAGRQASGLSRPDGVRETRLFCRHYRPDADRANAAPCRPVS